MAEQCMEAAGVAKVFDRSGPHDQAIFDGDNFAGRPVS
jgi:hypothetical protein